MAYSPPYEIIEHYSRYAYKVNLHEYYYTLGLDIYSPVVITTEIKAVIG
jgi:hypothetical protein